MQQEYGIKTHLLLQAIQELTNVIILLLVIKLDNLVTIANPFKKIGNHPLVINRAYIFLGFIFIFINSPGSSYTYSGEEELFEYIGDDNLLDAYAILGNSSHNNMTFLYRSASKKLVTYATSVTQSGSFGGMMIIPIV